MLLSYADSERMLKKYGIKTAKASVVHSMHEAEVTAERLHFPVVMKLLSPALIHKTDAGAVVVGVKSHDQVRHTFHKLSTIPRMQGIPFEGILVQETLSGHEIIIGGKQDLQFGPVVLFGLGGIFVQILKDTSLRVAPIGEREAEEMIKEIKSYPVLAGARGRKAANIKDIAQMISAVSNLMYKENVSEMDLNPCFAGDECVAADLRIITKG